MGPDGLPRTKKISNFNQYTLKESIGKGGWGEVRKAIHNATGVTFAVKIINKKKMTDKSKSAPMLLEKECEALQNAFHQNIVKAQELCEDSRNFYIVMEFVNGASLTKLLNGKAISEPKARYIIKQLLQALNYLHSSMQIVHRDLKPDNVLYELQNTKDSHYHRDRVRVKLTDFGFATFFEKDNKTTKFVLGS